MPVEQVNYPRGIAALRLENPDANLVDLLHDALPDAWAAVYREMTPTLTNILWLKTKDFEYLFDETESLVREGKLDVMKAQQPRVVAVQGRSKRQTEKRRDALMRGRPLGPVDYLKDTCKFSYDKGHFIGHSFGGGLEINIFPQQTQINRGWSERGKVYRAMERYCYKHPGTYCFSRPLYSGLSWHPYEIEFGVLKADDTLWVESFPNCADLNEMTEIERMLAAKTQEGQSSSPT